MKNRAESQLKTSSRLSKTKQRFMLPLAVTSTILLASCKTAPTTEAFCPVPVYPSKEAVAWYKNAETPYSFDDFMDKYLRQQEAIELNCKD